MSAATNKLIRIFSLILLFLLGISAMAGGWELIHDPSGRALGWDVRMLQYSPFKNYLIPGIILFALNGISSIAIAIMVIKRTKNFPFFTIIQGGILICWIIIQVILIWKFNLLHTICLVIGTLLVVCGNFLLNENQKELIDSYEM